MTLRPEGTAPIVRAFVENKLYGPEYTKPYKTYYMGPMFAMNAHKLVVCVNSIKLVWKHLVVKTQH